MLYEHNNKDDFMNAPECLKRFLPPFALLAAVFGLAPLQANAGVMITDTIAADGKIWAQPDLFLEGPAVPNWYAIDAVCPGGACVGDWHINGTNYDMNGWTWASVQDLNSLFNHYLGAGTFGSAPLEVMGKLIAGAFFADGWRGTHFYQDGTILLSAWTRTTSDRFPDFAHEGSVGHSASSLSNDVFTTSPYANKSGFFSPDYGLTYGGWFYRAAEVPLPSTLVLLGSTLLFLRRRTAPVAFD